MKNQGVGGTLVPVWNDFVVLSQDPTITYAGALNPVGPGADQLLNNCWSSPSSTTRPNLAPGQSYTNTVDVTLPSNASGTWYVYVYANGLGFHYPPLMTEATRANNLLVSKSFNVQLPPTPDLAVTGVVPPSQAFSGQPMNLSWTVVNNGQASTGVSEWQDQVFMSPDSTFDSSAVLLTSFTHDGALVPGDSYTDNETVTLPVGVSGKFYFYVETNADGRVFENGATANDIRGESTTTTVNLTPPPDLAVNAVSTTTTSPLAGHPIAIQYTVANAGSTATPNSSWTDSFYLSPTKTLDPKTEIALGNTTHSGVLAAGASYNGTATLTIPNAVSGTYFLIAQTDSGNAVFEVTVSTTDHLLQQARVRSRSMIQARRPGRHEHKPECHGHASRRPGSADYLDRQEPGERRHGSSVRAPTTSTSRPGTVAFANPVLLGAFTTRFWPPLAAGASYSATQPVLLPASLTTGTYDIWVQTNAPGFFPSQVGTVVAVSGNGPVVESNTNNDFSTPFSVSVTQKLADLQPSKVTSSASPLQAGKPINVNWTETNAGAEATRTPNFWYDDVWLS